MKKELRIAVVSDMHVGEKARARDFCPGASTAPETGYRERFLDFVKDADLHADYLILPGDVSNKASPAEFALASDIVQEIAQAFGVDRERVIYVPGNHDVDWAVMAADDPTGFRRSQRYAPLQGEQWMFREILSRSPRPLTEEPYFSVWEYDDLVVVGYNSSSHDEPSASVHHGLISTESLGELGACLDALDLTKERLKLFLVHHHPVQYSDPIPNEPDFSAMTNAGNLLKLLRQKHFDLVVHGHKHCPRFETYIIDSGFPLAILCAGSFSSVLDTRWSGYVNNQFHMIDVDGRDSDNACIFGVVRSWTYLCGKGWTESQQNNGIPHASPFGTYLLPETLKATIEPLLRERLEKGDYVEWRDVVEAMPQLKHLQPERVIEVLDALAINLSFRRHGSPPDEVVLLKS